MTMPLEVTPEHLYTTSAGLTAAQVAASTGIAAASAPIVPTPAGADDVSTTMAASFAAYAASFLQAVSGGLVKHLAGAQVLAPVAAGYQATDASSSVAITAQGSTFA
jgi:PE family